ncbi:hypothetical protein AB0D24_17695 [Streptomyces javensis]|uniref:hypothetical protein n=1 Tax=Streptomyces javensis TaxID=114698 RepID=UPI0033C54618
MFALVFADDRTQTVPVTLFNFISYPLRKLFDLAAVHQIRGVPARLHVQRRPPAPR